MHHEIIGTPLHLPNGNSLPLSRAVKAGDFLFLSGQLGVDDNFNLAAGILNKRVYVLKYVGYSRNCEYELR